MWDAANLLHIGRHEISRAEVEEVFAGNPLEYPAYNRQGEERAALVGPTLAGRMLFVVFTLRGKKVRVVTAYPARRIMRKQYDEYIGERTK